MFILTKAFKVVLVKFLDELFLSIRTPNLNSLIKNY